MSDYESLKQRTMQKEQIIIEKGQKVVELTLDQLRQTRTFADAFGIMPRQFPIEHHVFIQKLIDFAEEVKAEPKVGTILAAVKNVERISETEAQSKGLDQNDAENTAVKVLVGRIDLGNKFARKLWNLSIGFMYHEKGIEVAIGTNISVCSNLTIFGDTTHYKNYGRNGIEITEMFSEIQNWFGNLEKFDFANSELLERMDKIFIDWNHDCNIFLGKCLRNAVKKAYHKGDAFAVNIGQVSKIASYIIKDEENFLDSNVLEVPTLYHLYNAGTYVLTHNDDLTARFTDIKAFTEWFEKEFLIPYEVLNQKDSDDEVNMQVLNEETIIGDVNMGENEVPVSDEAWKREVEDGKEVLDSEAEQLPDPFVPEDESNPETEGLIDRSVDKDPSDPDVPTQSEEDLNDKGIDADYPRDEDDLPI